MLVVGLICSCVFGLPYFFYIKIMAGTYAPDWYNVPIPSTIYYTPQAAPFKNSDFPDDSPFWRPFHIGTFLLRLSYRHPALIPMPQIELSEYKRPIVGLSVNDATGKKLFTFRPLRIEVFNYGLSDVPLLSLPLSRKILKQRELEKVWEDLFAKNLKEYKVSYKQLLTNLHTLFLRWKYFPPNSKYFFYLKQSSSGLIELPTEDRDFQKFYVMKLVQGKLVSFEIEIRRDHSLAQQFMEKFLREMQYMNSTPELSDQIYLEFKDLSFQAKLSDFGFLLLYSAYSHKPMSAPFFKEMVRYLERQEKRPPQLPPLYDFGFNYFGSNFSTLDEERRETQEMALKRKMEQELEKELAKYDALRLQRGEFKNDKEKMDYQLKEAKSKKKLERPKETKGSVDGQMTFE